MRNSFLAWITVVLLSGCGSVASRGVREIDDPFTGKQQTFNVRLDDAGFNQLGVGEAKGKYALEVLVANPGIMNIVGAKGDVGEFSVGDSILKMASFADATPTSNIGPYTGPYTQWIVSFSLAPDHVRQLSASLLKAVKVHIGETFFVLRLDDSQAKAFQTNMQTMIRKSPPLPFGP